MAKKKKEALSVRHFISDVLIEQLKIPSKNIVNDTTFKSYTKSDRPDLLISEVAYDLKNNNDHEFIKNLIAYAEAKDDCVINDKDWKDAIKQGLKKSKLLKIPYFIVTNCKVSYFFNSKNGKELKLNGSPIREFQSQDILRIIYKRLSKSRDLDDISTSVDAKSAISEATFNKKLWELAYVYRNLNFKNISEKIDFTIGFIALKYFEEKIDAENNKNKTRDYWSDFNKDIKEQKLDRFLSGISGYIKNLEAETEFIEFKELMELVHVYINKRDNSGKLEFDLEYTSEIYTIIDSMGQLHDSGFDLFGAVYEKFAGNKEKSDFGEFFTRRHYTHVFSKLLLQNEKIFDTNKKFTLLDPACGTGGFLTEAFKVLQSNYKETKTLNKNSLDFIKKDCFFGWDVKIENVSRTKLNMFLVGDGHTNIIKANTLKDELEYDKYDYVITNPPYGNGTDQADSSTISSKRTELAFIARIINLLKVGGKSCIIIPDGFFENPSYEKFRIEILEKVKISAIISLPKFAFAPYTKEKTYALYFEKKSETDTKIQKEGIWMYIIDNDGFANSDKRFPTKMKNSKNEYLHDEISFWVDKNGDENLGLLEDRWLKYDDSKTNGTEWIDEKGIVQKYRKGGFVKIKDINSKNYYNLLPEFHFRPYEPKYISEADFINEIENIEKLFKISLEL